MSTRTRFTLASLAGATVLAAAACVPPPAVVAPTTTTSTTTTSTTTTSTTVAEVDPNDWVGQCYSATTIPSIASILVGPVVVDDVDHWGAEFLAYPTSDCSGPITGSSVVSFGADADEGAAGCNAVFDMMTDGGTMAERFGVVMPVEARSCVPDLP